MSATQRARVRHLTQAEVSSRFPDYPKPYQVNTFYAAMGRAIAAWQSVEANLYEVYRATTGAQRPGAEAAAFFSVPAFRAKLNMTTGGVSFALQDDPTLFAEWKTLSNRAQKKADWRNAMAHGAVWTMFRETRRDRKIYIGPNLNDPREQLKRKPGQDTEPLTLARVRQYETDFRTLASELRTFSRKIPPPVVQPQAPPPPN
jgi:hypothetical protein